MNPMFKELFLVFLARNLDEGRTVEEAVHRAYEQANQAMQVFDSVL